MGGRCKLRIWCNSVCWNLHHFKTRYELIILNWTISVKKKCKSFHLKHSILLINHGCIYVHCIAGRKKIKNIWKNLQINILKCYYLCNALTYYDSWKHFHYIINMYIPCIKWFLFFNQHWESCSLEWSINTNKILSIPFTCRHMLFNISQILKDKQDGQHFNFSKFPDLSRKFSLTLEFAMQLLNASIVIHISLFSCKYKIANSVKIEKY